jgi:glycosyltransferase involved in cell wall biosynthesis
VTVLRYNQSVPVREMSEDHGPVHARHRRQAAGIGCRCQTAIRHVSAVIGAAQPDVVHGHGAKGGAYARLARASGIRVYTPHGGSLHYGRWTAQGMIYGTAERIMMRRTNLFLFESNFARSAYQASIGTPRAVVRVVPNGVSAAEFHPVAPAGSTDVITIGELRYIKAIDVLIEAIAQLSSAGRHVTATVVGEGPDGQALRQLAAQRRIEVCSP